MKGYMEYIESLQRIPMLNAITEANAAGHMVKLNKRRETLYFTKRITESEHALFLRYLIL